MDESKFIKVSDDLTVEWSDLGNIRIHSTILATFVSVNPDELIPLAKSLQLVAWKLAGRQPSVPYSYKQTECPACGAIVASNWLVRHIKQNHPDFQP